MLSRTSPFRRDPKHTALTIVILGLALLAGVLVAQELGGPVIAARKLLAAFDNRITPAVTSVGPRQSSPVALSGNNQILVNVNPESNTVSVFDVSTDTPTKLGEVVVGNEPRSVAVHPDGTKAYVANSIDGTVSVLNLQTRTISTTVTAGAEPMALALSPNGTRLYVANSASNNLMVFDTTGATPSVVATIDLSAFGTAPRAISITNNGDTSDTDETIFVALFYAQLRPGKTSTDEGQDDQREGHVVALSAATNTGLGVAALGPMAKTFNGNLGTGFNSNGQLAPGGPPAGSPPNPTPAVPSINPQSFTTPTGAFPNQLASIAIQPGQSRAYVVSTAASPNGPLRFNVMAQGMVSVFDTSTRAEITGGQTGAILRQTAPLNMNQGVNLGTTPAPRLFLTNPVAMSWRPDGSDAWIAVQQSDLVVRLTVDAGGIPTVNNPLVAGPSNLVRVDLQNAPAGQIAGKAPQGLVINSTGTRLYCFNFVSRSITVVNITNPTSPTIAGTASAVPLPAPNTPEGTAHLGEELFYSGRGPQGRMSQEAWGSCAVCHPNGRSDNVTWMFDAGPRQTIPLDGTFNKLPPHDQRILNWSGIRDENQDFELNTRNVFGGRGLIDDDRLFLAFGGASGVTPTDSFRVEQFQQFTGAVTTTNDLFGGANLQTLPDARRDFAVATLPDDRVFIIGGRSGAGQGTLITGTNTVLEFNPRTNVFTPRSSTGFTPRHSFGAAAVRTVGNGIRIYAIGGFASTLATDPPVATVEEYNPSSDTWRAVATLPTPTAQFGITVAGGINTAEPLQLIHIVSGNGGSEAAPSVIGGGSIVQRFQPDPVGPGTWSAFSVAGLTPRRNHGAATAIRGVQSRIFVIGGQDAGGTVLDTVEEYLAQALTIVGPPARTSILNLGNPAPRARFGIGYSLSTNQIYVVGGVDGTGADQTTVLEYTVANNTAIGTPGTPTGSWAKRGDLSQARRGLQLSTPPGVTNFLPVANTGRDASQDSIAAFVATIRSARAPVPASDPSAAAGQTLFNTVGLVQPGFSCATCHGGPRFTRSIVDYTPPPSPEIGLGLGNQRVIGAELRQTATQPNTVFPPFLPGTFPGVLVNVGTFTPNSTGGRVNEIRVNPADPGQSIAPLGANGFNFPSLLSVSETAPYFYSGLAQTLDNVLDGSQDGNGGTQHHFVANATQRAQLVAYLRSIEATVPQADLVVSESSAPNPVTGGGNLTYTISVFNRGPNDAKAVLLSAGIPSNTTFVSANETSGPASVLSAPPVGGTGFFTAEIPTLVPFETATFQLTVRVTDSPGGQPVTNVVIATASTVDSNMANNTATNTVQTVPVAISINDVSVAEPASGSTNATFTVTLSFASTATITVDYFTSNGTADEPTDYTAVNGTLTFAPGVTTRTILVPVNADSDPVANETFFVNLVNSTNATISNATGVGTILDTDALSVFQFSSPTASVAESAGAATVTIIRTGDSTGAASVHFETSDGTAKQKNRYTFEAGTATFGPGETSRDVKIPIVNNVLVDGNQTFQVNLSVPSAGSSIGNPASIVVAINDDDTGGAPNPIDDATFFVRQQYLDFLGREPDPSGLAFWVSQITSCGSNASCVAAARVNTSAAFFFSIEYQETGGFALRMQRVAFGRQSNDPFTRVPYLQFMRDERQIGQGVVVGVGNWQQQLETNKQAYAEQLVADPNFTARFPAAPGAAYVDALYASAGVTPTDANRTAAINAFGAGGTAGRVAALRSVADSNSVRQADFQPSFVLAEYYGYLRRNPTDPPDFNDAGYQFWLAKLNQFNGDFVAAEMVKAFINSSEYRQRFGP